MELIADVLLIAAALSAAFYCWVLSRRVHALQDLDQGVGSAIAEMSRKIEDTRRTLETAKKNTDRSAQELGEKTARAEMAAGRLELLLASLHTEDGEVLSTAAQVMKAREAESEVETPVEQEKDSEDVLHTLRNIVKGMRA